MGGVARRSGGERAVPGHRTATEPDVHVRHHRPPQGRRAAADDVRRRGHDDRARGGALQGWARRLRHPSRRRADVPHRPAVGRAVAGCGQTRRGARPVRRGERAAIDRDPSGRDDRDGADPLHPPAVAAGRRAGALRRQLAAARGAHRRLVPHRREAQDDRLVRSRAAGLLRRHRGRHDVHDLERGVAGAPRDRSGARSPRSAPSSSTTRATSCRPVRRASCTSRTPRGVGSSTRATRRRRRAPTSVQESSRSARSAT